MRRTVKLEDIEEAERSVERERVVAFLHYMADHYTLDSNPRRALHAAATDLENRAHWSSVITQRLVQDEIDHTSDEAIAEILRQAGCTPPKQIEPVDLWRGDVPT